MICDTLVFIQVSRRRACLSASQCYLRMATRISEAREYSRRSKSWRHDHYCTEWRNCVLIWFKKTGTRAVGRHLRRSASLNDAAALKS